MKLQRRVARADARRLAVVEVEPLPPSPPVPAASRDPLPVPFAVRRTGVN